MCSFVWRDGDFSISTCRAVCGSTLSCGRACRRSLKASIQFCIADGDGDEWSLDWAVLDSSFLRFLSLLLDGTLGIAGWLVCFLWAAERCTRFLRAITCLLCSEMTSLNSIWVVGCLLLMMCCCWLSVLSFKTWMATRLFCSFRCATKSMSLALLDVCSWPLILSNGSPASSTILFLLFLKAIIACTLISLWLQLVDVSFMGACLAILLLLLLLLTSFSLKKWVPFFWLFEPNVQQKVAFTSIFCRDVCVAV